MSLNKSLPSVRSMTGASDCRVRDESLSIVVLNHNGADYLRECLQSLEQDHLGDEIEVVVVDNASDDNSCSVVKESFPWVRLIASQINLGASGGRNLGYRASQGRLIWFLDSDTEVVPGSVAAVRAEFRGDQKVAIVGCLQKDARHRDLEVPLGASIDRFGFVIPSSFSRPDVPPFFVPASAIAVRRDVLDVCGGFDERFFIFWEEIDLCWRCRLAGYGLKFATQATVYHYGGTNYIGGGVPIGLYTTSLERRYLGERNMLATLLKNYSLGSLILVLPPYLLLLLAEIAGACLLLRAPLAWQYVRALAWNIKQLPNTLRLRGEVQRLRSLPDKALPFDPRLGKWLGLRAFGIPRFVR